MEQLNHVAAQVRDIIVSRIESHEYLPGEMIPSERVLAEMYGVSRPTIRTAIDELVNEHYLVRRQGKGTGVREIDLVYQAEAVDVDRYFGVENGLEHCHDFLFEFKMFIGVHLECCFQVLSPKLRKIHKNYEI